MKNIRKFQLNYKTLDYFNNKEFYINWIKFDTNQNPWTKVKYTN